MKYFGFCFVLIFSCSLSAQKKSDNGDSGAFTFKTFYNLTNFFSSKNELMAFFDFKAGDTIADVGAGEGKYGPIFSLMYDSLVFYLEDIDAKLLNTNRLEKIIKRYSRIKGAPLGNEFKICIGGEKSTGLPDNTFDKIIIQSAFHEFTYVDEMLDDLAKKIKPGGRIYILDAHCMAKGHRNFTGAEVIAKMKEHGFKVEKSDTSNPMGARGMYKLVFVKA